MFLMSPLSPGIAATVLHDVRVIDGNGGLPMEHADVVLSGDRIVSIAAHARIASSDAVIDLG